ncbi:MAG TPA: alpha/beta hydrolase-fold protein [Candidatus Binataceae bacterium]|nr:alpha/beta hydrolase-fold protein [Candidatus Binataceae bacterium]
MPDSASKLITATIETALVPSPSRLSVLLPAGYDRGAASYPLMYLLHGGDGDNNFLGILKPLIERAWERSLLPPLVVVTPDADRSFYVDYRDGSRKWETFILGELLSHVRRTYRVDPRPSQTVVAGISMGGLGALRMAFKHPEMFAGVAALEPGIEPALSFDEIDLRDRFYRSDELLEERFGRPVDRECWKANNPANIAIARAAELRASKLPIYIEAADEDAFYLFYGAEFLHRVLFDAEVKHEYRLVRGADHLGRTLEHRFIDAFRFLGLALNPPPPDESLNEFHKVIAAMKRHAGYSD